MRQKPSLYYHLLDEIDYLLTNYGSGQALQVLSGFITAVFFLDNSVEAAALVNRFTSHISASNASTFVPQLYELATEILRNYPLHKDDVHYFCLVDWLVLLNTYALIWNVSKDDISIARFLYTLVDRLLTSATDGLPIVSHLIRLERIINNKEIEFNFDVMWISLSYALLKVQTIDEQKAIVRVMINMHHLDAASNIILRVAYIPYYQLMSELNDKGASKDMVEFKKQVLNMITFLDNSVVPFENAEERFIKVIPKKMSNLRLLCHLEYLYKEEQAPILDSGYNTATDSVLTLNLIFSVPFVFFADNECLIYSRIAEISSIIGTCYKFPILLFFLRRLHASSGNAVVVTHILKDVIPTLVDVNDPIITSKVLQVILTSINNSGSNDSAMASLGVKALAHTHNLQPRVWQELKKVFAEWVLRRKSGTVRRRIDLTKTGPIKMELTILTTMRDVCKSRPRECAPDILPMVISLLQTCQDLSMASLSIMVDIINTCVQTGLVEARSIWNIAVVYLAQFSLDQGVEKSSLLVKQLCRFFSIAGAKDDVTEAYLQFKESLLKDYILPLIQSNNEDAVSYAVYALSDFPAQDISVILPEKAMEYVLQCTPDDGKPNKNQHEVLITLMSNELDHMRRGLFKEEAKQQQKIAALAEEKEKAEVTNEAGEIVGEREIAMETSFINSWEEARVAPGLRSGYATAILHILESENATIIYLINLGLVNTVRLYIPSFAASCANDIIEVLMKNYIVLSGSPLSHSAHLMSEEVQFAAKFALGHLAGLIISNDKLASTIYKVLMDSATHSNTKSRNIDTAIDLVQFASGYAAGHFVASLAMWPTVTEQIETLKDTGIHSLISYCSTPASPDSRVLGIMMGLASKLKPTNMGEELQFAISNIKAYLDGKSINKGLLFGSTWLAAAGALKENQIDLEISGIIESVMTAASNDINSAQHFYHFSVPYTQIQLHSFLYSPSEDSQAETLYWDAFEPLLNSIQNDDASSNYRIASLFSLGSLLGVNYLSSEEETHVYTEAEKYRSELRYRGLDSLCFVAGLNSKSAPIGNLKSGRIAAAICGKVIETTKSMIYSLKVAANPQEASAEKSTMTLLSASSEPISYSRLNSNTSYIRAVFDRLVVIASDRNQIDNIIMLLNSLIGTPGPLPPVNWFSLVTKISKLSTPVQALCLSFASTHATTSLSLSEFLLTQMMSIFTAVKSESDIDRSLCDVFFTGKGLATVLELSGLPRLESKEEKKRRGMSAVIKRITISESRAIEIIELLGQKYQYLDYDTQHALLSNFTDHLPVVANENKENFVSNIREIIMQSMTLYTFEHSDKQSLRQSGYEKVVRKLVECSVTDISILFPTGRLDDWKDTPSTMAFAKTTALCEFYRSHKKQPLVKYMSAALVHLIGMSVSEDDTLQIWDVMAETMRDDKDEYTWMIRVLDAYVVYIGSMDDAEEDNVSSSIEHGLYTILAAWRIGSPIECCPKTQAAETAYSLGTFVSTEHTAEQEQVCTSET
ncbi:uncharacterized protein EV154DRAFT_419668 [Mucor mucedo]|uniref:uncharacterized protein n=1 Tax=Mucor mucedo TaxID=29922 RepID=UPI002220E3D8|nr:uncharacterized protein EV154DRAFT_419668 [Mucor mucedo]KAI7891869.1 hypothetical protein EV154DRAFT_419668 [Mucor mucedo]